MRGVHRIDKAPLPRSLLPAPSYRRIGEISAGRQTGADEVHGVRRGDLYVLPLSAEIRNADAIEGAEAEQTRRRRIAKSVQKLRLDGT